MLHFFTGRLVRARNLGVKKTPRFYERSAMEPAFFLGIHVAKCIDIVQTAEKKQKMHSGEFGLKSMLLRTQVFAKSVRAEGNSNV